MLKRESFAERQARFETGARRHAISTLLGQIIDGGLFDEASGHGLAMLVVDAALDGDEISLHDVSRQLQLLYRSLIKQEAPNDDTAEARGRTVALLDVCAWALERSLSLATLAEIESSSTAHQFLKQLIENPGVSNGDVAREIGISNAEASRIGRQLSDAGLAAKRRIGRRNHWEVTPRGMQSLEFLEHGGPARFRRPHYQLN